MPVKWVLAAVAFLTVAPGASAQRLEVRTRRVLDFTLAPSLGIDTDSLVLMPSGVYYRDIQLGTGPTVQPGDSLQIHFVGWLTDGTRFSATERVPFGFRLGAGRVIAGWEAGVAGMQVGGRRQVVIPPAMGYGPEGKGAIPGNATLVFDLTLVDRR